MLDIFGLIFNVFGDIINFLGDITIYNGISILSLLFITSLFSLAFKFLRR